MSRIRKFTKQEEFIYKYLDGCDWTSPTEIGREYGLSLVPPKKYHSSWASPKCLRLHKIGLLERNNKGHYRLIPQLR